MSFRQKALSGVKWTTLSSAVVAVVQLLKISILARYLDTSDFGLMAIIVFVIGFLNLFMDMGISSAILYKKDISRNEYGSLYTINLIFSALIFISMLLVSPFVADYYNQARLSQLIPLMSLNIVFAAFGRQFKTVYQKNLNFKKIGIIESISAIISLVAAIYIAYSGYGIYSLIVSVLLQNFISNTYFLVSGIRDFGLKIRLRISEAVPFLKIGLYQTGAQIVNFFNRDFDILIIGKLFGPEILGGYSLAKQLVFAPVQLVNPILTKVASPLLAKFQDNISKLRTNYLRLVNIVATINIPIYLFIIILAEPIIFVLYGADFEHISLFVRVLSLYMIIRAIGNPVGSLVIATGRTELEFYWNLIVLLVLPISIWIGAEYGINGVVYSILLSRLLLFVPSWYILIWKSIKVPLSEYVSAIVPRFKSNYNYFITNKQ